MLLSGDSRQTSMISTDTDDTLSASGVMQCSESAAGAARRVVRRPLGRAWVVVGKTDRHPFSSHTPSGSPSPSLPCPFGQASLRIPKAVRCSSRPLCGRSCWQHAASSSCCSPYVFTLHCLALTMVWMHRPEQRRRAGRSQTATGAPPLLSSTASTSCIQQQNPTCRQTLVFRLALAESFFCGHMPALQRAVAESFVLQRSGRLIYRRDNCHTPTPIFAEATNSEGL